MPHRPLLWVTVGVLAGDCCAAVPALPAALAALCLVAVFRSAPQRRTWLWIAVATTAAAVGSWRTHRLLRPHLAPDHIARRAGTVVEVAAWIVESSAAPGGRRRLVIDVTQVRSGDGWIGARGSVLITVQEPQHVWRPGDHLRGHLRLRRPRNFGNPGEFDYESHLARRRIYVTAFAANDRAWNRHPAVKPRGWFDTWRAAIDAALTAAISGPARDIAAALLIGTATPLAADVRDRYARTGLSHVLSISGLHIALVAGPAYAACRWLLARSERLLLRANVPKLALAFMTLPVGLYAGLAGGSVPTLRSVATAVLLATATLVNRPRDWLASLAAAALAISLAWPGSVLEISFQLSFVSVLAIVLGMQRVNRWWRQWEERHLIRLRGRSWLALRWLVLTVAVTGSAVVGTAPLTVYHFQQLSLIAVLANPLVVPLLGLAPITAGLLAAVLLPAAPGLALLLFKGVGLLIACADALVALLARVPYAAVETIGLSLLELALCYGLLAAALTADRRRRRVLGAACGLLLVIDVGWWTFQRYHGGALRLTFLSVGHGDSTVIEFPRGAVMVVDGGGLSPTFDTGARLVTPFLAQRKIGRLDALVMTHPDFDHFGGLAALARRFAPPALWWTGIGGSGYRFAQLRAAADAAAVPLVTVRRGLETTIDGVDVRVLFPGNEHAARANDTSLTVQLHYGGVRVLLPGDLEAEGERRLVVAEGDGLASTVLKVPHHGSRTSSTDAFLDAVRPRLAVISAGHENRFGLPNREVIAAYVRRGIALHRTDQHGAVVVAVRADGHVSVDRHRTETW